MASDSVRAFVRDVAKGLDLIADATEKEVADRDGRIVALAADLDTARELLREAGHELDVLANINGHNGHTRTRKLAARIAAFLERKP